MYTNQNGQRACTIKQMSYTVFTKIPVEAPSDNTQQKMYTNQK